MVKRESGEFGFRIHGARPVVVSAIETGTAAENSGLQVGDIIISINDMCVLDASHSEFVSVAHGGSDVLELEVARTCDALTPVVHPARIGGRVVMASRLWKFSIGTKKMKNCWQPRYFCLKSDHCLYYYKSASLKRVGVRIDVFGIIEPRWAERGRKRRSVDRTGTRKTFLKIQYFMSLF